MRTLGVPEPPHADLVALALALRGAIAVRREEPSHDLMGLVLSSFNRLRCPRGRKNSSNADLPAVCSPHSSLDNSPAPACPINAPITPALRQAVAARGVRAARADEVIRRLFSVVVSVAPVPHLSLWSHGSSTLLEAPLHTLLAVFHHVLPLLRRNSSRKSPSGRRPDFAQRQPSPTSLIDNFSCP